MNETEEKVYFTKSSGKAKTIKNELEVSQDLVKLKIKQKGTITVEFKGEKESIAEIEDYFEGMTDMEPVTMNIADSGDIKAYFKGTSPLKEETSPQGETYYIYGVTIQELIE